MTQIDTHLCGNIYDNSNQCEHLVYAMKDDMSVEKKKLKKYYVYCTAGGKCRSLGFAPGFTGNSPISCPKRKAQALKNHLND